MKLKHIFLMATIVVATKSTFAQYSSDALRFSQFSSSNTARFDALGGTKTAIGGDLSSLYGNPAGLGMFSKSEFNFTPSINLRNNDISFNGASNSATNNNVDLNNLGVVFHSKTYKKDNLNKGLLSINFGIGYQKRSLFRNEFNFSGQSNLNGLSDFFTENSNAERVNGGIPNPDNLTSEANYAAYYSYLTDYQQNSYRNITYADADQAYNFRRTGGNSEIDLSFGVNVSNNFFIGGGVGLSSLKYTSVETTNEKGSTNPASGIDKDYNVDYTRNFDTEGSGVNFKLGFIIKPVQELRIGLSAESPTWYSITDKYSEELLEKINSYSGLDSYPFEYNLKTPFKLNGGLAYFIGTKGFISADIGFVDYSSITLSSETSTVDQSNNNAISSSYKNVINYSVGGEYKLNEAFLLRLGYQSKGNPYRNLANSDFKKDIFSGGFGYRFGVYYFDMALLNSNDKLYYSNYSLNNGNQPIATVDTRKNSVSLTFGVRF
ncbi:MAG: outer membrane protein transport protein [Pelobium sp.]